MPANLCASTLRYTHIACKDWSLIRALGPDLLRFPDRIQADKELLISLQRLQGVDPTGNSGVRVRVTDYIPTRPGTPA